MPDLVEYLWGTKKGETWQNPSKTADDKLDNFRIYPNPANQSLHIEGLEDDAMLEIYTLTGVLVTGNKTISDGKLDIMLPTGIYMLKIQNGGKIFSKKVMIE